MDSFVSRENMIFFMKEYHPYYRKATSVLCEKYQLFHGIIVIVL